MTRFAFQARPGEQGPIRPMPVDLVLQEDLVDSDDGMVRTRESAPLVLAVLYDGTEEAYEAGELLIARLRDLLTPSS